jgi:glutamate carboxypeptidase
MSSLDQIARYRDRLLADLERLVNMDSYSHDKADVDRVGAEFRKLFDEFGFEVIVNPSDTYGDSLMATLNGSGTIKILMVGHMDTVHPKGTTARLPYRVEGDIAYGPGTVDMKAGDLMGIYAMRLLQEAGATGFGKLSIIINSDEEIGSPSSRAFIEEQAKAHDVVLVLEGPQTRREIVSRRKGGATFKLTVHGRAAHAGVEPELGRNALLELAHQIIALQALNDLETGTTVNVCIANAGIAHNAIPGVATASIDVRALNAAEADRIVKAIHDTVAKTTVPDTLCEITGGFLRPPMEKTEISAKLIELTQRFAVELGTPLKEITMGGGTDGNFTAAAGVPTLDGMGPDGGLSHSEREFLELPSIWERMAILIKVIEHLSAKGLK